MVCDPKIKSGRHNDAHCNTKTYKMPCTTHASMHSAPLRKKSDALRSSARSGYLMRRLRHAVSRPCDAICAVLEPSAVLRVVRCGRCCSHLHVLRGHVCQHYYDVSPHYGPPSAISIDSRPPLLASGAHSIGFRMVVCCLCIDLT